MADTFLLLEILDPVVNTFLWRMRDILSPRRRRTRGPIHLTVRGPYEGDPPSEVLKAASEVIRNDVIRIGGVGRFSNPESEDVVFLRVHSPHLKEIWWKRDYPIETHGFNPHITIHKSKDVAFVDAVQAFLKREPIEFLVAEHRLAWYRPSQPDFLISRTPTIEDAGRLAETDQIDFSILDRLEDLRDDYHLKSAKSRIAR